jgi:hypothetical protein
VLELDLENADSAIRENVPISDKLKKLGVRKFIKQGGLVQLILKQNRSISFNINKSNFNKTIKGFQEAAVNGFAGLSRYDVDAITSVLINPDGGYIQYLTSPKSKAEEEEDEDSQSLAHAALDFIKNINPEIFIDQFGEPYIVINITDHLETLPIDSARFKSWLCKEFFEKSGTDTFLTTDAFTKVLEYLIGIAQFDGVKKDLQVRVAGCTTEEPYTIYYDLTNPKCEVVKITPDDWTILSGYDIPTIFRKYKSQKAQVTPSRKYPSNILDQFIDLLNITNKEIQREKNSRGRIVSKVVTVKKRELFKGYLFGLMYPGIPKPVFMPYGGQNAAKSTTKGFVKLIIDPASPALLSIPDDKNEMAQQLMHHYVCYYDNLTKLADWQSNQLCRAATGAGDSKRKLFSNDEDILYEYIRATGFSGIYLVATQADLLSRGLIIKYNTIPDKYLRDILEVKAKFNKMLPQLLGFLFDIMVKVLRYKKTHHDVIRDIKPSPRMVDFAQVAELALRFIGYKKNQFIDAYNENVNLQTEAAIDGNPLGIAIKAFMSDKKKWNGTASDLLAELEFLANELTIDTRDELWPKAPHALSRRLTEMEGHLKNLKSGSIVLQRYTLDTKNNISGIEITKMHQVQKKRQKRQKRQRG